MAEVKLRINSDVVIAVPGSFDRALLLVKNATSNARVYTGVLYHYHFSQDNVTLSSLISNCPNSICTISSLTYDPYQDQTQLAINFSYSANNNWKSKWTGYVLEFSHSQIPDYCFETNIISVAANNRKHKNFITIGGMSTGSRFKHIEWKAESLQANSGQAGNTTNFTLSTNVQDPINPLFKLASTWNCSFGLSASRIRFVEIGNEESSTQVDDVPGLQQIIVGLCVPVKSPSSAEDCVQVTIICNNIGTVQPYNNIKFTYESSNATTQNSFVELVHDDDELDLFYQEGSFANTEAFIDDTRGSSILGGFVTSCISDYSNSKIIDVQEKKKATFEKVARLYKNKRDSLRRTVAPYFASMKNCPTELLHALFVVADYDIHEVDIYGFSSLDWAHVNKTAERLAQFTPNQPQAIPIVEKKIDIPIKTDVEMTDDLGKQKRNIMDDLIDISMEKQKIFETAALQPVTIGFAAEQTKKRQRTESPVVDDNYEPNLQAEPCKIGQVLSPCYYLHTDKYQRPYQWLPNNVVMLMSDIKRAKTNSAKWYFLSTIVLAIDESEGVKKHYIVDGQQRLTTITILLAVVLHYLPQESRDLLYEAIKGKDNPFLNQRGDYRLNLYHEKEFFLEYIQKPDGIEKSLALLKNKEEYEKKTETQKRLLQCVNHVNKKLRKKGQKTVIPEEATDLIRYVLNNCYLVVVEVKDKPSQALRIFRTLNARGRDISQMDNIKVDFLQRVSEEPNGADHEGIGDRWEQMVQGLGEEQFQEMFRFIYSHRTGSVGTSSASHLERAFDNLNPILFFYKFMQPTFVTLWAVNTNHLSFMDEQDEDLGDEDSDDEGTEDQVNQEISISLDYLKLLPHDDWKLIAVYVLARFKYSMDYFGLKNAKPLTRVLVRDILSALLNRYTWNWIEQQQSRKSDIKPRNTLKKALVKNCQDSDWTMLISTLNSVKDKSAIIAHISGTGRTSEEYTALNRFLLLRVNEMRLVQLNRSTKRLPLHEVFANSLVLMPITSKEWKDADASVKKARVDINRIGAFTLQTSTHRGDASLLDQQKANKLFKKEAKKLAISHDLRRCEKLSMEFVMRRHMGICNDIAKAFDLPVHKWDKTWLAVKDRQDVTK